MNTRTTVTERILKVNAISVARSHFETLVTEPTETNSHA